MKTTPNLNLDLFGNAINRVYRLLKRRKKMEDEKKKRQLATVEKDIREIQGRSFAMEEDSSLLRSLQKTRRAILRS